MRTGLYLVFRACERFGLLPPGMHREWDELPNWQKQLLIGFEQIREREEAERMV